MSQSKLITLKWNAICRLCRAQILAGETGYFERPKQGERGTFLCLDCQHVEKQAPRS